MIFSLERGWRYWRLVVFVFEVDDEEAGCLGVVRVFRVKQWKQGRDAPSLETVLYRVALVLSS